MSETPPGNLCENTILYIITHSIKDRYFHAFLEENRDSPPLQRHGGWYEKRLRERAILALPGNVLHSGRCKEYTAPVRRLEFEVEVGHPRIKTDRG